MSETRQNTSPWSNPWVLLATGLGAGASPLAPGTVGTLWGIPLTIVLAGVAGWPIRIALIVAGCLVGIPICDHAAKVLGQKDPGAVVWDEFATVPIVFLAVPLALWRNPTALAVGFVLHRIFDITKIPPVCHAERLPGGLGIMLDDVVAALYAAGCMAALNYAGLFG